MKQITLNKYEVADIKSAAAECNLTPESYSGRGMYGTSCLGIIVSDISDYTKFIVLASRANDQVADYMTVNTRADSMGLDSIYYWPNIAWEDEDDSEEDRLVAAYDRGGQAAVYEYVNDNHPDWKWDWCEPCESDTPVWETNGNHLCAACFSVIEHL